MHRPRPGPGSQGPERGGVGLAGPVPLAGEGAEARAMSAQAFRDLIETEMKRWDKVAKQANIRAD